MHSDSSLLDLFNDGIRSVAGIAPNPILALRRDAITQALQFAQEEPAAAPMRCDLYRRLQDPNFVLDEAAWPAVLQRIGELDFWRRARDAGLDLEPIAEQPGVKTPDFLLRSRTGPDARFEVKTLDLVFDGVSKRLAEASFEGQLRLSAQISSGRRLATDALVIAPYGETRVQVQEGTESATTAPAKRLTVTRTLIRKTSSNIDSGQFKDWPTFLVLNLLILDGHDTTPDSLRKLMTDRASMETATGQFWALGFWQRGEMFSDWSSEPGASARFELDHEGILRCEQYDHVAGILLVVHPWREPAFIAGLFRSGTMEPSSDEALPASVGSALQALVGTRWNDESESNSAHIGQ